MLELGKLIQQFWVVKAKRQKFWVVKAKRMIRSYINNCNTCRRYRADTVAQKMGILPAVRVTRADKPFRHIGVITLVQ